MPSLYFTVFDSSNYKFFGVLEKVSMWLSSCCTETCIFHTMKMLPDLPSYVSLKHFSKMRIVSVREYFYGLM